MSSKLLPVVNVGAAQLNTLLVTAGAFVLTPAILHGLGDASYGGWLLMNSFIGYMRMLEFGTGTGTMKYGAGAYARGDKEDVARVFNTTSAMFGVVGALAALVTLGLALLLPRVYPRVLGDQLATILLLGGAATIDLAFRTFPTALRTRSLFFVPDSAEITTYIIFKLGLILYFASRGLDYRILALITLGETVVRNILVITSSLLLVPETRHLRPDRADRGMFRKLAAMSAAVSIIGVADMLRFQVDAAVIGLFMPHSPESIAIFGIGGRLLSITFMAIGVIGSVLMPRFAGDAERGDWEGVRKVLRGANLATGLLSSYVLVNLAVLGPHFLELWLQKPWVTESGKIMLLLLPAYYIALLSGPATGPLFGSGKMRGLTIITLVEGVANLGLSIALVGPLGLYGVALGTAIPMVLVRGVVLPLLLKAEIGLTVGEYARTHARPVILGVVYLLLVGAMAWVPLTSYLRLIELGLTSTLIYGILLIVVVPEVRTFVIGRYHRFRGRTA